MHGHTRSSTKSKTPPVVLVGNPNVGKSVIFGYLSGKYVTVSNFPGTTSKIMFTTPAYHERYERLTLLGVEPGAEIKLNQKIPSFVVKVDQTEVALDRDVAQEIFVRPSNGK